MRASLLGWRDPTIDYDDAFWFALPPEQVWAAVERFDRFEAWWGWLREFRVEREGLVDGNVLRGTVVPPLPYRLRVTVRLERCEPPALIEATVDGDLRGRAALSLTPSGEGTDVGVRWSLAMVREPVRTAARVAYPVVRWGHDRVVEMAVAGFSRRVAADRPDGGPEQARSGSARSGPARSGPARGRP